MSTFGNRPADRESRLYEVLGEYYAAIQARLPLDHRELMERNPDLAEDLAEFFREQESFHRALQPLRDVSPDSDIDGRLGASITDFASAGAPPDRSPEREDASGPLDVATSFPAGGTATDLGDYQLLGEIARGGMGVVFKARHRALNRLVALKMILHGRLASREDVQRFRNEAEMVARLDHPHIVPIYQVGEHHGYSFFSMKLIAGGDLAQRLGGFATDPRSAARLIASIARAVHHAHQRGILHRDLKPSNILLDEDGHPYVTDFGLAKCVEADLELTESGAMLGTPSYMAPEQTVGKRGEVTTATDVYGLGAVFYAMLSGRAPFRGDSALETIEQVRDRPPEPPSGINRLVDLDLQTICMKCLEKDPQRRYESARELAEELDRWLRGEPIRARQAGRLEILWRWCRRPGRIVDAGAFAAFTAALLIAWNLLGIALVAAGVGFHVPNPRQFIADCFFVTLLFYLPVAVSGVATLRRRPWAPWAGSIASLLTLLAMLFPIFDLPLLDFGGFYSDHEEKLAVFTILALLIGIQLLAFLIALVAQRANPPRPSPDGRRREPKPEMDQPGSRQRTSL